MALPASTDQSPYLLLVDDDAAVGDALKFSMELEGFQVRTYPDAEALLAAAAMPDVGCLVIDLNLPDLDGLELLRRLRARKVGLPAVIITTNPTAIIRARALAQGTPIVEKPLLTDALLETIRGLMRPPETPAPLPV